MPIWTFENPPLSTSKFHHLLNTNLVAHPSLVPTITTSSKLVHHGDHTRSRKIGAYTVQNSVRQLTSRHLFQSSVHGSHRAPPVFGRRRRRVSRPSAARPGTPLCSPHVRLPPGAARRPPLRHSRPASRRAAPQCATVRTVAGSVPSAVSAPSAAYAQRQHLAAHSSHPLADAPLAWTSGSIRSPPP